MSPTPTPTGNRNSQSSRGSVAPGAAPGPQPSQASNSTATEESQANLNTHVAVDFVTRLSRCQTIGEVVRLVPAPAQEKTKEILDRVYESFIRRSNATQVKLRWKDALDKQEYESIPELNSLKRPVVQLSKLAETVDKGAFAPFNFSEAINTAKKAALEEMIRIKTQEIKNLDTLCEETNIQAKVKAEWMTASQGVGVTPEHLTLLLEDGPSSRIVQAAISIGRNAVSRSVIIKQKKNQTRADAEVDMTDPLQNKEQIESLVMEMIKRREQSKRDKSLSGKGKGRAGPPKKKNQKESASKVQKKKQRTRKPKKQGSSTKGQRKKR
jgi:hypothetical protein